MDVFSLSERLFGGAVAGQVAKAFPLYCFSTAVSVSYSSGQAHEFRVPFWLSRKVARVRPASGSVRLAADRKRRRLGVARARSASDSAFFSVFRQLRKNRPPQHARSKVLAQTRSVGVCCTRMRVFQGRRPRRRGHGRPPGQQHQQQLGVLRPRGAQGRRRVRALIPASLLYLFVDFGPHQMIGGMWLAAVHAQG